MLDFGDNIDEKYRIRREIVFLVMAGLFLGSLTMLNILGLTKLIEFTVFDIPVKIPVGVLPYPITFLCTDFISELFGKRRATLLVWIGLMLNAWVLFILWIGHALPPHTVYYDVNNILIIPPDTIANLSDLEIPTKFSHLSNTNIKDTILSLNNNILPDSIKTSNPHLEPAPGYHFYKVKGMTFAATFGSMIAYLLAQFVDVQIFHFLKKITNGRHMWLRNNGSTLISQLVDSFSVILIAHYLSDAFQLTGKPDFFNILLVIIFSSYITKFLFALMDTIPFYYGTKFLSKYLAIDHLKEYRVKDKQ